MCRGISTVFLQDPQRPCTPQPKHFQVKEVRVVQAKKDAGQKSEDSSIQGVLTQSGTCTASNLKERWTLGRGFQVIVWGLGGFTTS